MSNPSGPDQDAAQASAETQPAKMPDESPTNAISTGDPAPQFESAEPTEDLVGTDDQAERRYSAPSGFDVRSTQIIPTQALTDADERSREEQHMGATLPNTPAAPATSAAVVPPSPPPPGALGAAKTAMPQSIPARPSPRRHRSWLLILLLILAIAALIAVVVGGTVLLKKTASPKISQEDLVRQTIAEFDTAIQKGDIVQLRGITCGDFREGYANYKDEVWSTTYRRVAAAKRYPMVASIDQVVVNDQRAEANVTTFMAYAPQVQSTRSFDLQYTDGRWKICQAAIG